MKPYTCLYLAGPMTGLEEQNYPAFREACRTLRAAGHRIASPHEDTPVNSTTYEKWVYCLKRDLLLLLTRCDGIVLLPGWENSKGAQLELHIARQLGYFVYQYVDGKLIEPESITTP